MLIVRLAFMTALLALPRVGETTPSRWVTT